MTEIALKVRLLDITGDGVELPEKIVWGQGESEPRSNSVSVYANTIAPRSVDFWYAK